jgi:DNA processing protein
VGTDRGVTSTELPLDACDACLRRAFLVAHLAPRIAGMLSRPRSAAAGLLALPDDDLIAAACGHRPEQVDAFLESFDPGAARDEVAGAQTGAFCRHADGYPVRLRDLTDPPAVVFAVGRAQALDALSQEPSVAIVGTRSPSSYGTEAAYSLGRGLGASGVVVVSGLALGIDATAHRGCLAGGGVAVAVLACGANRAYPRRHRALHEEIRRVGVVLSEVPPDAPAYRWSFPARNRIMAALAQVTVVVEAADGSGTLITSDFAQDLGRGVAAVPGRITWSRAVGPNRLIKDGATPITGAQDVLDQLFGAGVREVPPTRSPAAALPPLDARVLDAVEADRAIDDIATAAGSTARETRAALGRLEAAGHLVRRDLGGWERAID